MGAKQSKRSVDISGKEAESAGEVAAAGAVVEGRVEQLAEPDALKPQLNGDAHIHQNSDKEKQLDSGTPENEKDATTEKEGKEDDENDKEKVVSPVTNGDTEAKQENGETTPTPEDGKKPKKEKVKKKWSLRSISFSRKDKPKQEKKQKEEDPKANGEPEKLAEEAAEATPDVTTNEVVAEAQPEKEKAEVTPETPVTEPLTNGSSTPETPKVESPPSVEEPAPVAAPVPAPVESAPVEPAAPVIASPEPERQEPKAVIEPEQLPVNGLSLEESTQEILQVAQTEDSKPEEVAPTAEKIEIVPAPEIPVKKEVCVEQMPLESTPPPLPANPPPSSVASFAATTMAPELTDASLANTTELVISAPHSILDTKQQEILHEDAPVLPTDLTNADIINNTEIILTESPIQLKENCDVQLNNGEPDGKSATEGIKKVVAVDGMSPESNVDTFEVVETVDSTINQATGDQLDTKNVLIKDLVEVSKELTSAVENLSVSEPAKQDIPESQENIISLENKTSDITQDDTIDKLPESPHDAILDSTEDLPPPPPPIEDEISVASDLSEQKLDIPSTTEIEIEHEANEVITKSNHISDSQEKTHVNIVNGNETEEENLKNKAKDSLDIVTESVECNGSLAKEERAEDSSGAASPKFSAPPSLSETAGAGGTGSADGSEAFPPPPSCDELQHSVEPDTAQEPIAVSDKLADLIPEVPVVPDLKNETETSSDVAVVN